MSETMWRPEDDCDLGVREYDQARYCYKHGGFVHGGEPAGTFCHKHPTRGVSDK